MIRFPSDPRWPKETMTVKELREALASYPDDMPIFAEWEGCLGFVDPKNFLVMPVRKGWPAGVVVEVNSLVIDVNEY